MIKGNDPAFPTRAVEFSDGSVTYEKLGMSLRDYIAIQSIVGTVWQGGDRMNDEKIAEAAYKLADAMLEARKAGPT